MSQKRKYSPSNDRIAEEFFGGDNVFTDMLQYEEEKYLDESLKLEAKYPSTHSH
ncbi:MAG: hypothetical protein QXO30_01860 [Candidatus Caldarchaeum sp.]